MEVNEGAGAGVKCGIISAECHAGVTIVAIKPTQLQHRPALLFRNIPELHFILFLFALFIYTLFICAATLTDSSGILEQTDNDRF